MKIVKNKDGTEKTLRSDLRTVIKILQGEYESAISEYLKSDGEEAAYCKGVFSALQLCSRYLWRMQNTIYDEDIRFLKAGNPYEKDEKISQSGMK